MTRSATPALASSDAGANGALIILSLAQFMLIMDVAIVNVALPAIQRDLHFTTPTLGLVITAYAITFGGLLLLGGRVADLVGRRRVFLAGLVVFTTASLLSGSARSAAMLVVTRAAQGVGGAFMAPAALALLITIFPAGIARNRALGIWSALAAAGGAAGLILGGILTDVASWRWIFLINVPVGISALVATLRLVPMVAPNRNGTLDIRGAITATSGAMLLTLGVGRVGETGLADGGTLLLLGSAALLLALFLRTERQVAAPLLDLALCRRRTFTGANLATLLMSAIILGVNYFLTLYFQGVLHYSPLQTGQAFLPITLISGVSSLGVARLVGRMPSPTLFLSGMLALGGGALVLVALGARSAYLWPVLPALIIFAIGLGTGYTMGTLVATTGVPAEQQGAVSGVITTSQQLGGALGLATLTAIATLAAGRGSGHFLQGLHAAAGTMAIGGVAAAVVVGVLVRGTEPSPSQPTPALLGPPHTAACQPALTAVQTQTSPTRGGQR